MTADARYAGMDAWSLLASQAARRPNHPLLVWAPFDAPPGTWTYARFLADAERVAGGLAAQGVREGDRVLVAMENSPEFLLAWFACARLGATCAQANPASAPPELDWFASHLAVAARLGIDDVRRLQGTPPPVPAPNPARDAAILFTSGTTARPKGVRWTHGNVLWGAQLGAMHLALRPEDVVHVCLPLCHVVAFSWSVLPAIRAGATVLLQPRFSASRYWDAALAHRATVGSHVQFTAGVLARQPAPGTHAFRVWGNSFWSSALASHLGAPVVGWYGMTELVSAVVVGDPAIPQAERSIGRPSVGYEVRIALDDGRDAPEGEAGNLLVRGVPGTSIFAGYYADPAATAAAFTPEGWFRTDDRALRHADGSIQFAERLKDVIKVGGENVSPAEVERVLLEAPGVREAAVVGRPDAAKGELVIAFVAGSGDDLAGRARAHCASQLARYKVPAEVIVLDALPRGNLGKIAKNELRERAASR